MSDPFGSIPNDIIFKLVNPFNKLSDQLPPDIYARILHQFKDKLDDNDNIDIEVILEMYTPLMVAFHLQLGSIDHETIPYGIDMHFLNLAKNENKTIVEVESIERQIAAFEEMNDNIIQYINSLLDALEKEDADDDDTLEVMLTA
jgi:uncharacterized protein YbaP (TraB family)